MLSSAPKTCQQLRVGLTAQFERVITEQDVLDFARVSGDHNPLHTSSEYAAGTTFGRCLVHGALQVGLASAMVGMHLPGAEVLLGSVQARFPRPLYYPARLSVKGEVVSWKPDRRTGSLRVLVQEENEQLVTAEITLGFTFHERRTASARSAAEDRPKRPAAGSSRRRMVLVTGASGAIGAAIAENLAPDHHVLALHHRKALSPVLADAPGVTPICADLADSNWERQVSTALGEEPLFGVVHAAWPGLPKGGLLGSPDEVIDRQLNFGTTYLVQLARMLYARATDAGGRFVALGSTAGGQRPVITMASYSLAKGALEHTVRLLAPELARRNITINAVCPSLVPVGMNRATSESQRKLEAARIPMGRLCMPEDVVTAVRFLLCQPCSYMSGQVIGLTGAQL